jgi:predicted nucleic acid-binding protein
VSGRAGSLDTNAILRLIVNDIPAQATAVAALVSDPQRIYAVADLAIVEVEYALRTHYGFSRGQIQETLGNFIVHPSIQANVAVMKRAFEVYLVHSQLSFTDCCLAAYAEVENSAPLWTFDQKLAKQSDGAAQLIAA